MFPANHVHVRPGPPPATAAATADELVAVGEDPVAREIAEVAREWRPHVLASFVERDQARYTRLTALVAELIRLRWELLSVTSSAQQTRALKARATALIDRGNRLLKLDLVPRSPGGEALDADNASVIELLHVHQEVRPRPHRSLRVGWAGGLLC